MNIVVLFSLILVVGMLVDGAIVTVELADRKLQEGNGPRQAYAFAAKRMSWPIIASTATTLSVFLPLLFWTGVVGEFMKYLPITVILTLSASLFMALIFIPVMGGVIGRRQPQSAHAKAALHAAEVGDPRDIGGFTGAYVRLLQWSILSPWTTVLLALSLPSRQFRALWPIRTRALAFFPSVEPEFMQVEVRARDNLSIYERDALVRVVEDRLLDQDGVESVYARSTLSAGRGRRGRDRDHSAGPGGLGHPPHGKRDRRRHSSRDGRYRRDRCAGPDRERRADQRQAGEPEGHGRHPRSAGGMRSSRCLR